MKGFVLFFALFLGMCGCQAAEQSLQSQQDPIKTARRVRFVGVENIAPNSNRFLSKKKASRMTIQFPDDDDAFDEILDEADLSLEEFSRLKEEADVKLFQKEVTFEDKQQAKNLYIQFFWANTFLHRKYCDFMQQMKPYILDGRLEEVIRKNAQALYKKSLKKHDAVRQIIKLIKEERAQKEDRELQKVLLFWQCVDKEFPVRRAHD